MGTHIVTIEGRYEGDLRCRATHAPSGEALTTDAPVDNEGRGESFSPTDLVATGYGACLCTIIGIVARRRGADVSGMRFRTDKEMTANPVRRIGKLSTTIWLPTSLSADERAALESAARNSPVCQSIHPDIETPLEFRYA